MAERMTVLYDASKCTACQACSVSCKQWNCLPGEKTRITQSIQGHNDFTPLTWTFISFQEKLLDGKMLWNFRKNQCFHCREAGCKKSCNYGAISRNQYGFVVINQDKCIGCGYCVTNCPFHVPRIDPSTNKAYKCTGCPERVANGMAPACVSTCQPECLLYGTRRDMLRTAQERLQAIQETHPRANIYGGDNHLEGLNFLYILLEKPSYYGLPDDPQIPLSLTLWKDIVRPVGMLGIAGALGATLLGFIMTRGQSDKKPPDPPSQGGNS